MTTARQRCEPHQHLWQSGNHPPRIQRCAQHHYDDPITEGPRRGAFVIRDHCLRCGSPRPERGLTE